jgi:septal ring factor EnvC (AmiA/AmiB activator)
MSIRPLFIALLLFAWVHSLGGVTTADEIKKRQAELQKLRDQIQEFEQKIKAQQQSEKATLELLDSYDRKATLLRRLLAKLRGEEKNIQKQIDATRKGITALEEQLAFLKQQYAQFVVNEYKRGQLHDLELLLTSASVNQFYVRAEYLRRFTEQRQKDAARIVEKRTEIELRQVRLQQQLGEERRLIAEKGAEEDRLVTLAAERKEVLGQIRRSKQTFQREIERKIRAARELENIIADLIEADRLSRERLKDDIAAGRLPQPPPTVGTFEARKGKIRWPVPEGAIVARFGNVTHPTLRTITQNTGIDIAVNPGTPVTSVAGGEVRVISWLPSYGNLVIVDHYNGYRTVYTHLSEINVTEGQKVEEGGLLGMSGESLDGPRLHFELWKDREKQNPEHWLSRR